MKDFNERVNDLSTLILSSNKAVFFGGAGVSTESGIQDFRGKNGIYKTRNKNFLIPKMEMVLSAPYFKLFPKKFFEFYRKFADKSKNVKPNKAHYVLAKLEEKGYLSGIITQNIDGLHQEAGSKMVCEIHGTKEYTYCSKCNKHYPGDYILKSKEVVPKCNCGGVIRPAFVLFGETLPTIPCMEANDLLDDADLLIVGGTSLNVSPAKDIVAEFKGKIVIINDQPTQFDDKATLIFRENIVDVLSELEIVK